MVRRKNGIKNKQPIKDSVDRILKFDFKTTLVDAFAFLEENMTRVSWYDLFLNNYENSTL